MGEPLNSLLRVAEAIVKLCWQPSRRMGEPSSCRDDREGVLPAVKEKSACLAICCMLRVAEAISGCAFLATVRTCSIFVLLSADKAPEESKDDDATKPKEEEALL
eukprot:2587827-Amphidinium_carterae.1